MTVRPFAFARYGRRGWTLGVLVSLTALWSCSGDDDTPPHSSAGTSGAGGHGAGKSAGGTGGAGKSGSAGSAQAGSSSPGGESGGGGVGGGTAGVGGVAGDGGSHVGGRGDTAGSGAIGGASAGTGGAPVGVAAGESGAAGDDGMAGEGAEAGESGVGGTSSVGGSVGIGGAAGTAGTGTNEAGSGGAGAAAGSGGLAGSAGAAGSAGGGPSCIQVAPDGDDALAAASGGLTPFRNVQPAIDFADTHRSGPTQVCVAQGAVCGSTATYPGPGGAALSMRDGISVYGDYESTTFTRCSSNGTTLAPGSAEGVYFGPTIVSPTVLDRFTVERFSAPTTSGITLDGARGVAISNVAIGGFPTTTTAYGVDATNGAEASLTVVSVPLVQIEGAYFGPPNQVGLRSLGATLSVRNSSIKLIAMAPGEIHTIQGVWFEDSPGSSFEHSSIQTWGGDDTLGIHVSDSAGFVLDGSRITLGNDLLAYRGNGAAFIRVPDLSWLGGSLTQYAAASDYGVLLDSSPNAVIEASLQVNTQAIAPAGVHVQGDSIGVAVRGSLSMAKAPSIAGIWAEECDDSAFTLEMTADVQAAPSASVDGILVSSGCRPSISTSVTVRKGTTNAAQSLTGIHCTGSSRCAIDDTDVSIIGSNTLPGAIITARGVLCDGGSCPSITRSRISGLSQPGELRNSRYVGGGVFALGATLVSGNDIRAGCSGGGGVGLVASGRIENNRIGGPACGGSFTAPIGQATGLVVIGDADVHSNTISAGGALDGVFFGQLGCDAVGISFQGGSATFRNNLVVTGPCTPATAFYRDANSPYPTAFEHNDLYSGYRDGSSSLTIAQMNALPNASDNFGADPLQDNGRLTASSPCVNAGTTTGAPPTDYDGDPRDALPDVGADERTACDTDNGSCDARSQCTPVPGGVNCGACPSGFTGDGASGCVDLDECALGSDDCVAPSACVNEPGTWSCDCPSGYAYVAGSCTDIDECSGPNRCDVAPCINTDGDYHCGDCPAGYTGTGDTGCVDIDECLTDNGGCDPLRYCVNESGSNRCGSCVPGYSDEGALGCILAPCLDDHGGCDPVTTCTNTINGPLCGPCPDGYTGDGATGCIDIDECAVPGVCDSPFSDMDFYCTNRPGGHFCNSCPGGKRQGCGSLCPTFACENGGVCVGVGLSCDCPSGVGGAHCEELYAQVSASGLHTCALTTEQELRCWGDDFGGANDAPEGLFTAVGVGGTCALRPDGTIDCWVPQDFGTPDPPAGSFVAFAQGSGFHACALRADGTVACWGSNHFGQGDAPPGLYMRLGVGYNRSWGIHPDGSLELWGEPGIANPSGTFVDAGVGQHHACGIHTDGTLECWGADYAGQTDAPDGEFVELIVESDSNCALRADGSLQCWGDPTLGKIDAPPGSYRSVALAPQHGCGVRADQGITCWGNPAYDFPGG